MSAQVREGCVKIHAAQHSYKQTFCGISENRLSCHRCTAGMTSLIACQPPPKDCSHTVHKRRERMRWRQREHLWATVGPCSPHFQCAPRPLPSPPPSHPIPSITEPSLPALLPSIFPAEAVTLQLTVSVLYCQRHKLVRGFVLKMYRIHIFQRDTSKLYAKQCRRHR